MPFNLTYEAEQEELREYRPTVTNEWGNSYTGQWINNNRDGYGIASYDSGYVIEGNWRND